MPYLAVYSGSQIRSASGVCLAFEKGFFGSDLIGSIQDGVRDNFATIFSVDFPIQNHAEIGLKQDWFEALRSQINERLHARATLFQV